jgi:hypothetical protein
LKDIEMTEENIKREDEIVLPPLKKVTVQFLRFIFSVVDLMLEVLRRSRFLLLIGLIAGLAAGYFFYTSRASYFEVSMIAESSSVHRKTLAEMIKSLNDLIASQSYGKLAAELQISDPEARQITHIEMSSLLDESLENDTSTKFNVPFKVIARIKQTELTDTFQNAIVNYLDNKPMLKKVKEQQVKYYTEKLDFIERELAKLDTLKTEYNRFFASSKITTTYYSNDVDPSNIYKHANELFNEKGAIMSWLISDSKPIQVIDEFKSPTLPQSYSRFKLTIYGALIGFCICFLVGLYRYLYRKTWTDYP